MPPNDQAPRYQLVDPSTGNVVGSVFGDGNGNVVIADETDTQTIFGPDGITTPALEAGGFNFIGEFQTLSDFDSVASSGDRGYITDEQQFARQS